MELYIQYLRLPGCRAAFNQCEERARIMEKQKLLRPPVEVRYREELEALRATDSGKRPENWLLSPRAVRTFILGSKTPIEYEGGAVTIGKNTSATMLW